MLTDADVVAELHAFCAEVVAAATIAITCLAERAAVGPAAAGPLLNAPYTTLHESFWAAAAVSLTHTLLPSSRARVRGGAIIDVARAASVYRDALVL